jgi:hypothetical protein
MLLRRFQLIEVRLPSGGDGVPTAMKIASLWEPIRPNWW